MSTNLEHTIQTNQSNQSKHEKRTPHIWVFIVSIVLTILAFVAVANEVISLSFAIPLILALAFIQALFQAFVWMHLNQKGHGWPILLMGAAFFFAVLFAVAVKLM